MAFKSIRWRLQIWYGMIFAILLSAFGITAFQLEKNRRFRKIDGELQLRVNALMPSLRGVLDRRGPEFRGPPPDGPDQRPFLRGPEGREREEGGVPFRERPPGPGPGGRGPAWRGGQGGPPPEFALSQVRASLFDVEDTNGFYYVIWRRGESELARSTNAPADLPRPAVLPPVAAPIFKTRARYREAIASTPPGHVITVGRTISGDMADLRRLALVLAAVGTGALLLGLAGGWWIATKAIQPIEQISTTALKISSGDLSQRIQTDDTETELGRLASVLNSTFARLEASFAQQGRFTSDAAHELRTPLTVMLTQTQSALARERPAPEYRESLESCQRAAQRMRKLLDSLLELARLDAGQEQMKRIPFDLAEVARRVAQELEPLASEKDISIQSHLPPLVINGDPERFDQVLTNLLSNAIYYNKQGGEIRLSGIDREMEIELSVIDTGPGIAPGDLPHIFGRFYRADQSRSGRSGRTGLGLAICKAIVEAHSGSISVTSAPGEGSSFTIHLPKAPGSQAPGPNAPAQSAAASA